MNGSRTKAILMLAAVFVAGAAAGIAGDRMRLIPRAAEATETETTGGTTASSGTVIERFADELGLTTQQRAEIDALLDYYAESLKDLRQSTQPIYQALMDSVRTEIEGVLDEGQRAQYRARLAERYGANRPGARPDSSGPGR